MSKLLSKHPIIPTGTFDKMQKKPIFANVNKKKPTATIKNLLENAEMRYPHPINREP